MKTLSFLIFLFAGFTAFQICSNPKPNLPKLHSKNVLFKDMLGVNTYEWNFLEAPNNHHNRLFIYEPKMELIKNFSQVRHYLDWEKLEAKPGEYTFNPTYDGGWNYDVMYERCKKEGIEVLSCLKSCPDWLLKTYPQNQRDAENVPAPYGSNLSIPASYTAQAKAAFQFAARYGFNKNIDSALVKVNSTPRWNNDSNNVKKIGLSYISYIECDNERDKWWKGKSTKQTASEYAANLSAFYDGDKGRLGKDVGVKTADPSMKVVMGGLATADVNYVKDIVAWCKENRGYKKNGEIDLCFDIINYHYYSNDATSVQSGNNTRGVAPELSNAGKIANDFVQFAKENAYNMDVWVTETGYDINPESKQRAIKIGSKSQLKTQADWIIRSSLFYARHGIKKLFFYQLYDDNPTNSTNYATSGLVENGKRRPAADYILQAEKLMGNYVYNETISTDPIVDVYTLNKKKLYVLSVPDEKGMTVNYDLNLPKTTTASVYTFKIGADAMEKKKVNVINGKLRMTVTETPVFVEGN